MSGTVLHLCSSVGIFGAERVILTLAGDVQTTPWKPIVGVFENLHNPHIELAREAEQQGIPTKVFPCRSRFDPRTVLAIRRFVRENDIEILHSHGYKSNIYGLLAAAFTSVRRVSTCHNWTKADAKLSLYAWLDQKFLRYFNAIVTVSDDVTASLRRAGIPAKRLTMIPNGVSLDRFTASAEDTSLRAELGCPEGSAIVAVIGRLSAEKGHALLLTAARQVVSDHPEAIFLIVGDGPLRHGLEKQAEDLGIASNVRFTGTRNDVSRIFALAACLVIPSTREGFPMVLLEAMASRTPVVATRVGAIPRIIEHDASGLLVEPSDPPGLAAAIRTMLRDRDKAKRLADAGHATVQACYSSAAMAAEYSKIYESVA